MARGERQTQTGNDRTKSALTGALILSLLVALSQTQYGITELVCAVIRVAVAELPSAVFAMWHVLEANSCGNTPWLDGVTQISGSCLAVIANILAGI